MTEGIARSTMLRIAAWAPLGLVVVAILIRLPTLSLPLIERHEFRQTQTAYTARIFHTDGIDLFHPELPVLGPPWEVPFEFPLFQAGAALLMDLGVEETLALRGLSLACFIVSALLLHALLAPRIGRLGAGAALVVFLFSPLGLVWSRASLIEYLAVAASLGFAVAGLRWRERGGWRWWTLALVLACVAMLVKITSAVFWVLPFALLALAPHGDRDRHPGPDRGSEPEPPTRRTTSTALATLATLLLVLAPLAVGLLWTGHADAIKAASEATAWLTSAGLAGWNFGSLGQRLDPSAWGFALQPTVVLTTAYLLPVAAIVVAIAAVRHGQLRFWTWMAIAYAAPLLIFFNLYYQHDYYSAAIAPAAAAIVGGAVAALAAARSLVARGLLVAGAVTFVVGTVLHLDYALPIYGRPPIPTHTLDRAAAIAAQTRPDQPVAILGQDWSPALLYYADRRGIMVREATWPPGAVARWLAEGWAVFECPIQGNVGGRCRRITAGE